MKRHSIDHLNFEADGAVEVQTGFAPANVVLEQPPSGDTAECVKFDLGMAAKHYAYTAAYLCRAGWTLAQQKTAIGYGNGWQKWCRESLGMSHDTADRYIKTAHIAIGRWRESQGLANTAVVELTDKMIAAATAGMEYKTATQMMVDLGVVSRPAGWGGKREGAGRKAAAAAAVSGDGLDMGDSATLMWLDAMRPFEQNRAAFHSAARDLNPNVAARFLEELRMLERTLSERVKGGR